jgi:NADH-quinone oxidoreductase subunit N
MSLDLQKGLDLLLSLLPETILSVWAMGLLLYVGWRHGDPRTLRRTGWLSLVGIAAAAAASAWLWASGARLAGIPTSVAIDAFRWAVDLIILLGAALVVLLSIDYLEREGIRVPEFYVLVLFAAVGMMLLAGGEDLFVLFLGLELMSVSSYVLAGISRRHAASAEAALKYFLLGAFASAFLLYGIALLYGATGTTKLGLIGFQISSLDLARHPMVLGGLALLLVGFGFKIAAVPFHMWTPDVYQGAPAPVGAYVATVSKGAMVALLLRWFAPVGLHPNGTLFLVFAAIAIASMVAGNLLALRQDNVKRILAYSSIAHLGYLLVAFLATGERAAAAVTFYLVAYFVTTLAAFGVVAALSTPERDAEELDDYRGLAARRPGMAAVFSVALFSLAGMPLTAGFIGKFFVVTAGAGAGRWVLVITLVLTSTIGLYYYTRLIVAMFVLKEKERRAALSAAVAGISGAVLAALTVLVLVLGVYPAWLVTVVERVVGSLP